MSTLALVLSGGGARGAYQAGVLSAIAHISSQMGIDNPFQIYSGVSAGAINSAVLACTDDSFVTAAKQLVDLWGKLQSSQVFHTDTMSLTRVGLQWLGELSLGGLKKATPGKALLETAPLAQLISAHCNFANIEKNIAAKKFLAVCISALDYDTTSTVSFIQGGEDLEQWNRVRRHSEICQLTTAHVMASAAIPMLFPPIGIDTRFFGDGCVRNQAPCSPAINLGAQKLIAIGVRKKQETLTPHVRKNNISPTIIRVANVLLNAVMMDGMELDIERIDRINLSLSRVPEQERQKLMVKELDYLWISPSFDIGEIAGGKADQLPRMIRYLLKGLGSLEEASEIVSYLLFDPSYCQQLIEMGYEDGMKEKEQIKRMIGED